MGKYTDVRDGGSWAIDGETGEVVEGAPGMDISDAYAVAGLSDERLKEMPLSDAALMELAASLKRALDSVPEDERNRTVTGISVSAAVIYRIIEDALKYRMIRSADVGIPYDQDEDWLSRQRGHHLSLQSGWWPLCLDSPGAT